MTLTECGSAYLGKGSSLEIRIPGRTLTVSNKSIKEVLTNPVKVVDLTESTGVTTLEDFGATQQRVVGICKQSRSGKALLAIYDGITYVLPRHRVEALLRLQECTMGVSRIDGVQEVIS